MAESQYYGTVRGRGDRIASRLGTKDTGLSMVAFSQTADLLVSYDHIDGEDWILISIRHHLGADTQSSRDPRYKTKALYYGPVKDLLDVNHLLSQIAHRAFKEEFAKERADEEQAS